MSHFYHMTLVSANGKTGPIPVSTTSKSSCPTACPMREACYAKTGPLNFHWEKVSRGERGFTLEEFIGVIKALPYRQLWRHNQAGDLPGDGKLIDHEALGKIVSANKVKHKRGFTYTHYSRKIARNREAIRQALDNGFTVNVSCESELEACTATRDGFPAVLVVPSTEKRKRWTSHFGVGVRVCPATYMDNVKCSDCGYCARRYTTTGGGCKVTRDIVAFPAHSIHATKADNLLKVLEVG